jgi:hypothetical protein
VQLKLEVWIEKQHNGYWLIPVHRPDRTEGRKRIKEIMPQVDELGRDQIKYAGKLGNNLEVYVGHNNRLTCDMANGSNSIHLDVHRFAQRPVPGLSHRHRTEGHARYGSVIYTYDEKGMTLYAKAA